MPGSKVCSSTQYDALFIPGIIVRPSAQGSMPCTRHYSTLEVQQDDMHQALYLEVQKHDVYQAL